MPWPHKNSDGIIPKKVDEDLWGVKKPPSFHTLDELTQMMKNVYGQTLPVVQHKDIPYNPASHMESLKKSGASFYDKQKYIAQLKAYGLIPKDWKFEEDPVLIPATEKKKWFWSPGDPVVAPMHQVVTQTIYIKMPGLKNNQEKVGASWVIDPTHDYTESEIRANLQKSFKAMEELIIKSLKENKK